MIAVAARVARALLGDGRHRGLDRLLQRRGDAERAQHAHVGAAAAGGEEHGVAQVEEHRQRAHARGLCQPRVHRRFALRREYYAAFPHLVDPIVLVVDAPTRDQADAMGMESARPRVPEDMAGPHYLQPTCAFWSSPSETN